MFPQGVSVNIVMNNVILLRMRHQQATLTLTFDLRPPKFYQFVLDSKLMLVPNLKKSPQSAAEIMCSRFCQRGGIKSTCDMYLGVKEIYDDNMISALLAATYIAYCHNFSYSS